MQMREGLSDYPRHSGATMSYPSFAKLPLKSTIYLEPQKYLKKLYQNMMSEVEDILLFR